MIKLIRKEDCCGCNACYNICNKTAITMKIDEEGFVYPEINAKLCSRCGLCSKVCPIINKTKEIIREQKAYIVQNKDSRILRESTSGGAFTAIAEYVLDKDGIVFGASFDDDFKVIHTYVESKEELCRFRNSKYVQSFIGETFRQVRDFLRNGRLVCFSGTPCQIEGLKSFLMMDYDNLITVDVVCRAVPSPMIWEKYKRTVSAGEQITNVAFRDKTKFGYNYSQILVGMDDRQHYAGVESDPYLRAFFSDLSDRPSCYECAFKKRYRISDFTIWDCFDPQKFNKQLDNNLGVTKILVQSEKGTSLISEILDNYIYTEVSADKIVDGVNEMFHSVSRNPLRTNFFADAAVMGDDELFNKYFPDTFRVRAERFVRFTSEKLGIYKLVKRTVKKILGK